MQGLIGVIALEVPANYRHFQIIRRLPIQIHQNNQFLVHIPIRLLFFQFDVTRMVVP